MKKVAITQDLCRMVELMLKGGAQQKEVGERLGISKATVSRIKTAGYDAEQYRKNTTERVEKENLAEKTEEEKQILGIRYPLTVEKVEMSEGGVSVTARQAEEQVEGQMEMELPLPVTITAEDLDVLRPALGIPPKFRETIIGKTVNKDIPARDPIFWEDL